MSSMLVRRLVFLKQLEDDPCFEHSWRNSMIGRGIAPCLWDSRPGGAGAGGSLVRHLSSPFAGITNFGDRLG